MPLGFGSPLPRGFASHFPALEARAEIATRFFIRRIWQPTAGDCPAQSSPVSTRKSARPQFSPSSPPVVVVDSPAPSSCLLSSPRGTLSPSAPLLAQKEAVLLLAVLTRSDAIPTHRHAARRRPAAAVVVRGGGGKKVSVHAVVQGRGRQVSVVGEEDSREEENLCPALPVQRRRLCVVKIPRVTLLLQFLSSHEAN
ncbi:unnamed protein product [Urochloa humidicola]